MRFTRRALLAAAAFPHASAAAKDYAPATPAPGAIRYKWNHGSICAATNRDPRIQVIAYNEDTIILRENIAVHWEAPFTYLLAGADRALLIDTGATPEEKYYGVIYTDDEEGYEKDQLMPCNSYEDFKAALEESIWGDF